MTVRLLCRGGKESKISRSKWLWRDFLAAWVGCRRTCLLLYFGFFSNNSWLVVSSYQSSSKVSSCCSKFRFHPHHLSIFCVFPCRWHRTEWGGLRWSHCTMGCESGLDDAVEAGMRWLRLGDTLIWSRVVIPESEKEQPSRFGSRSLDYCCTEYHSNPGHGLGCQTWFPGECPLELEMTQYQRIITY